MQKTRGRSNERAVDGDRYSMGRIIAGAIAGVALASVLMAFAAASGLLVASPSPSWRDTSARLAILSGVWMLLVVLSFALAGCVAGRTRAPFSAP